MDKSPRADERWREGEGGLEREEAPRCFSRTAGPAGTEPQPGPAGAAGARGPSGPGGALGGPALLTKVREEEEHSGRTSSWTARTRGMAPGAACPHVWHESRLAWDRRPTWDAGHGDNPYGLPHNHAHPPGEAACWSAARGTLLLRHRLTGSGPRGPAVEDDDHLTCGWQLSAPQEKWRRDK